MIIRLYLVRHGETEWNRIHRIQGGSSDTPLNGNGKKQAAQLAGHFKGKPVTALYSSPLSRALDTAVAIAGYHELPVQREADLREIDVGELEGMYLQTLTHDFSSYLLGFNRGEGNLRLPGGESLADVYRRAWAVVKSIVRTEHGPTIVVSHYFVILSIICAALDMPVSGVRLLRIRPASVSILDFDNTGAVLSLFNHTCHLDD